MISIGIIGKICSGKSTIAKEISERFHIPIISFGGYLIKYSKENHLPINRKALQDLGNQLILEDSNKFLQNVISEQTEIKKSMIAEGIRHISIFEEICNISDEYIMVFIDTPFDIRYDRYCNRLKESDNKISKLEFQMIDNHAVEMEIDLLKEKCHFIITDINNSVNNFFESLHILLDGHT